MSTEIVIVVDPTSRVRSKVVKALGSDQVYETERVKQAQAFLSERDGEVAVVVVGSGIPAEEALSLASCAQDQMPDVSVVMIAARITTALLQSALRAGVRDVLPASFSAEELREAVQRGASIARQATGRRAPEAPEPRGKMIAVFSSKGGSGKSFIASNLALLIAERSKQEVALVDLDLDSGDLAIMLQVTPARTFYDAAMNIDRLDAEALKGYLTPYRFDMSLLAAPLEPGLADKIPSEVTRTILRMLRETYGSVVIDGPSFFTEHMLTALEEVDEILLVASLDVPSIKNLKLALRTMDLLSIPRERIRIVLNRADSKVGLHIQEVEKALGTTIESMIPSSRDVPLCINRGVPVATEVRKSPVTHALIGIADAITAGQPIVGVHGTGGWLNLIRKVSR